MYSESTNQKQYERNEMRKQDIMFIRNFLKQMDQTRVLRWRHAGEPSFIDSQEVASMNETVGEHIGQMLVLATGVLLKARTEGDKQVATLDLLKINIMIELHDLEETLVGDARTKDETYYGHEERAQETVAASMQNTNIGEEINANLVEYRTKASPEARFVKAIDELQAWLYLIYTKRFSESTRDFQNPETIAGYTYALEFPTLERLAAILLKIMQNPKLFKTDVPEMHLIQEQYKPEQ